MPDPRYWNDEELRAALRIQRSREESTAVLYGQALKYAGSELDNHFPSLPIAVPTPAEPLLESLEFMFAKKYLMEQLPTLFFDQTGGAQTEWNDTPLVRDVERSLEKLRVAIEREIDKLQNILTEGTDTSGAYAEAIDSRVKYDDERLY